MAYQSNKPEATDRLKDSQSDIQTNFSDIKTAFDVNHEALTGTGGDEGKHKFLQMPEQIAAPVTAVSEGALYTVDGANSSTTELVFRRESNGSSIAFTEGLNADSGWTRFGSGLLMKWARFTIASAGVPQSEREDTFVLPAGPTIPAFTTSIYNIQATLTGTALGDYGFHFEINRATTTLTDLHINIYTNSSLGGWSSTSIYVVLFGI